MSLRTRPRRVMTRPSKNRIIVVKKVDFSQVTVYDHKMILGASREDNGTLTSVCLEDKFPVMLDWQCQKRETHSINTFETSIKRHHSHKLSTIDRHRIVQKELGDDNVYVDEETDEEVEDERDDAAWTLLLGFFGKASTQ
jgi:hypothetical protein